MRDVQRSKLYAWEEREVAPRDGTVLLFPQIKPMVDALWLDLGLLFPPIVEPMPRQARRRIADATRLCLRVPERLPSWVLLHELAHVLSSTADGEHDGHGPVFVGLYLQLLVRYLRLPEAELLCSLDRCGIEFDVDARPVMLDPPATGQGRDPSA
ncbi:hypothetical protein ACFOD4_21015 [Pseudoroseomonas globiformis]|uniref:Uncharacterized protein n=1 Tax=Teichococcus globiformis TaxID=2307229 RepID=A0ABV7G955_9PROT